MFFLWIFKILRISKYYFLYFWAFITTRWGHVSSHKKLDSIGSAILTLIGYKQAAKQFSKVLIWLTRNSNFTQTVKKEVDF